MIGNARAVLSPEQCAAIGLTPKVIDAADRLTRTVTSDAAKKAAGIDVAPSDAAAQLGMSSAVRNGGGFKP